MCVCSKTRVLNALLWCDLKESEKLIYQKFWQLLGQKPFHSDYLQNDQNDRAELFNYRSGPEPVVFIAAEHNHIRSQVCSQFKVEMAPKWFRLKLPSIKRLIRPSFQDRQPVKWTGPGTARTLALPLADTLV